MFLLIKIKKTKFHNITIAKLTIFKPKPIKKLNKKMLINISIKKTKKN